MNVHNFSSSGSAYDACQCDEDIKDGDVLVIESEEVAGVAGTWPVAVTVKNGELHTLIAGKTPEEVFDEEPEMVAGYRNAVQLATTLGWPTR
jgi:hypothetical protein